MKMKLAALCTALILICSLTGCSDDNKVESVSIPFESKELLIGDTCTLHYNIEPADLEKVTLLWTSSDENVAVVENGEVKAIGVGNADITLSSKNGKQDICKISVREPILPETLELSDDSVTIFIDDKYVITATIAPDNADYKNIEWKSSDDEIASVTSNGTVSAKKTGEVTITAATENGIIASCKVSVVEMTNDTLAKLLNEQPLYVSSVKYVIQSTRWKSLYPDMLQAILVNQGEDTIKSAVITYAAWDSNNLPVKIIGEYNFYGGSYCPLVHCNEINLIPNGTYGRNQGYSLSDDQPSIATFKACVVSYETFDGKSWENPYYEDFCKLYEGKVLKE